MRHICKKLGFVFRAECELLGFVLKCETGKLDLAIFLLDLALLFEQQMCLILQLLVGLLKLFLLLFKKLFGCLERLRLQLESSVGLLQLGLTKLQLLGKRL